MRNILYLLVFLLTGALNQNKASSKNIENFTFLIIPANVTVSNISSTSAIVNWDATQNSNNFLVKYRVSGSNVWTSVTVMGNTVTLEALVPCTSYEVQVTEVSSGDNSSSVFFSTHKNYCTSSSMDTSKAHLSNVTVTPVGGPVMVSNSGPSTYTDYRNDGYPRRVYLQPGSVGNIITVDLTWTAPIPLQRAVVAWIDFNGDGAFQVDERITENPFANRSYRFNVPAFFNTGDCGVTMRVMFIYSSTVFSSCGTYNYGETEDYQVYSFNGTLSLDEVKTSEKINLYPNPVSDILNISGIIGHEFEIYNTVGQKVKEGKIIDQKVNVGHLTKGTYFIQIKDKENVTRLKFIKK